MRSPLCFVSVWFPFSPFRRVESCKATGNGSGSHKRNPLHSGSTRARALYVNTIHPRSVLTEKHKKGKWIKLLFGCAVLFHFRSSEAVAEAVRISNQNDNSLPFSAGSRTHRRHGYRWRRRRNASNIPKHANENRTRKNMKITRNVLRM